MAKYQKKEKMEPAKLVLLIAAVLVAVLALAAAAMHRDPADPPGTGEGTAPQQTLTGTEATAGQTDGQENGQEHMQETVQDTVPEQTLPAQAYPLLLEDGKLKIENLFQYEGLNPDCGDADGKNVASLMLHNISDAYLEAADITLTLTDGTALNFHVDELPAGKAAMVFERSNASAEENAACADAVCTASWLDGTGALPDQLPVSVDGVAVTVTNNTGHDISELVIYCRCPLGEEYFGGIAYPYTVNDLSANESATVEAWDCILGMAEVVRIAAN